MDSSPSDSEVDYYVIISKLLSFIFNILSRVWVTIDGVWIGNWIYWSLTVRNYK
jgi:hypothetical protein